MRGFSIHGGDEQCTTRQIFHACETTRYLLPEVIELETSGKLPTATLATGAAFISDTPTR